MGYSKDGNTPLPPVVGRLYVNFDHTDLRTTAKLARFLQRALFYQMIGLSHFKKAVHALSPQTRNAI